MNLKLIAQNPRFILARNYVIARMQESSTWRGLIYIATGFGAAINQQQAALIVPAGIALGGLVAAMFPDAKTPPTQG